MRCWDADNVRIEEIIELREKRKKKVKIRNFSD